jgi:hypothetical protein
MWSELVLLGKGLVVWTGTHYAAVHGYQWLCVPATWWGAAMAPVMIAAPHCRGLVWLIDASSLSVIGAWAATGLLLSGRLLDSLPGVVSRGAGAAGAGARAANDPSPAPP